MFLIAPVECRKAYAYSRFDYLLGLTVKSDNPIPESRTADYYRKRPCVQLVGDAARLLEEMILQKKIEGIKLKIFIRHYTSTLFTCCFISE